MMDICTIINSFISTENYAYHSTFRSLSCVNFSTNKKGFREMLIFFHPKTEKSKGIENDQY